MNIVLIFDQGLAGAGGKTNPHQGLAIERGGIGSYLMLKPFLDKVGAKVSYTLYCGNEYFLENKEEVVIKMRKMVEKINPDLVLCGPCFNFEDYGLMSAMICKQIIEKTNIKAISMMSKENEETIRDYKDHITILKMPKKGGTGLSDSFDILASFLKAYYENQDLSQFDNEIY
ncbi:MAG: GrdB-related putative oxidoreductase [Anaerococcus sp.]|nr:GrdB-related putative oxidoreductase [Anaerococcus sp.]